MRALLLMLTACGSIPEPLPPNVVQACARVIACGVCTAEQEPACIACLEHWAAQLNAELIEQVPPFESIPCDVIADVLTDKRIVECINEEWWQ